MKLSDTGLDLIKEFEGLSLTSYPDPGTGGEPITIGYGHTGAVKLGDEITEEEADALLRQDVASFEGCVSDVVTVPLTQGQYDALVSFAFNVGCKAFANSTLLRLLNAGDVDGASRQFSRWNKSGGRVLPGLVRRREAERRRFVG